MIKNKDFLFTSESVSEGHPDKICDRISDSILDLYIDADPEARVAVETLVTTDLVLVSGEVRSAKNITKQSIEETIRSAVKEIGYEQDGFHWKTLETKILLHEQSADIAMGVDSDGNAKDEGAGDQGIMFGLDPLQFNSKMKVINQEWLVRASILLDQLSLIMTMMAIKIYLWQEEYYLMNIPTHPKVICSIIMVKEFLKTLP